MMNAVTYGHKEVVKVFFSFGYTVDTVVKQGKMLLEWAIENGHLSLIEVIIINCMCIGRENFKVCFIQFIVCIYIFAISFCHIANVGHD